MRDELDGLKQAVFKADLNDLGARLTSEGRPQDAFLAGRAISHINWLANSTERFAWRLEEYASQIADGILDGCGNPGVAEIALRQAARRLRDEGDRVSET